MLKLCLLTCSFVGVLLPLSATAQERVAPASPYASNIATVVGKSNLLSQQGRHFDLIRFHSAPNQKPSEGAYKVLIQGGLHGNEILSTKFVEWLATRVAQNVSPINQLPVQQLHIDFLPAANPDGVANNTRGNAIGVNLNRNFGVLWGMSRENPGPTAFSEPETRALKMLMEQQKYDAAIDVHGYVSWVVAPSDLTAIEGSNSAIAKLYRRWMAALQKEIKSLPQYQLKTALQLNDGGAFEDWSFWRNKTLSVCLELKTNSRYEQETDMFLAYEQFVYRVLSRSVQLKASPAAATILTQAK